MKTTAIVVLAFGLLAGACQRPGAMRKIDSSVGFGEITGTAAAARPKAAAPEAANDIELAATEVVAEPVAYAETPAAPRPTSDVVAREVTVPAGTRLPIVLDTPVASDTSRAGDEVRGHLARPLVVNGETVLGTGTRVTGVVSRVVRSGRVKGRAHIAVRFDNLTGAGVGSQHLVASTVSRTAPATKKNDTLKVVAPAAGGAIIGRIAGGRKGALVGTAIGAGAGGAVVMSTRGREVRLIKGTVVSIRLAEPLRVPHARR